MAELDVSQLRTVQDAMALIDAVEVHPRPVRLLLAECRGLYLAETLHADRDDPAFVKSLMDGYAVRAADAAAGAELLVVACLPAGTMAQKPVERGQAMAIMTGAALPEGADAVVPVEQTRQGFVSQGQCVTMIAAARSGQNISPRGSNIKKGDVALAAGCRMEACQMAVAAAIGSAMVNVYAPVNAAVLTTGDELVGPGADPGPAGIRNSNGPMMIALLNRLGCRVRDLGICPDDPRKIRTAIEDGLRQDVLFISGGMSMGERDFVPKILAELGGELKVTKLRIKPGKPFMFAQMSGGKFAFGLPGNPVSAFVCATVLARRLLERMMGAAPAEHVYTTPLGEPLSANGPRDFYQPAQIRDGRVYPLAWKGSADIYTLARADCLIVRPADDPARSPGDLTWVMHIGR
ncbi:MAG TPA: gephyrin-like molybdotransferase Glp [Tepidisphaeraceae bacterium]|nr:gephyrin-like molybdotransferase Glp [Tepidisphaeraceae bacterium]